MRDLITRPNLEGADDVYEALLHLHEGLSEAESLRVWARLVLILANHIGDPAILAQALALARPEPGARD